ncbi:MAG: M14 family metallopeptidase [Acidobacteriota bacterium]
MNSKQFLVFSAPLRLCGLILLTALAAAAQVPQPKDVLGFTPGDDRKLASWAQTLDYFRKLDAASNRVQVTEIGNTTMGVPMIYAAISSPENLKNLEKYRQINAKLADPRRFRSNDAEAKKLIAEGKTIVLITCGVHSDEVGSELSSMLIAYKLASSDDPDIKKILDNTIILLVPSLNPDGVDIVKNWYDKTLGTPYEGTDPPELYNKYVGHDDNRDWYAFTQIETQLVVDKIHNVWHPQIVHDIHQQGEYGSRLFLPPYMQPVEPNVPKQIVEGYKELGNYMAADLRKQGFQGITTDSTYDAWTPSRAYSHYHGGVRILSETASCKLATPITVKFDELRPGEHYDPRKEAPNFGPVWKGGEWHIGDITRYMTTAAFSLLNNAADNREKWLSRFYEIGKDAVRPRNASERIAFVVSEISNFDGLESILNHSEIEYEEVIGGTVSDPDWNLLIKMRQPYASFAKSIFERQAYPDLRDDKNNPVPPYDVTAHSVSLLQDFEVEAVSQSPRPPKVGLSGPDDHGSCGKKKPLPVSIYRSYIPAIDEGWTRFILSDKNWKDYEHDCITFDTSPLNNNQIQRNAFASTTIIFPDQSPNSILNGYAKGSMPDEYTGGVGKEGVENLKKFVEAGGTLVFLNRASDFAIEQFNLPVRDVTKGLSRKDFYIPGSILRTELDLSSPIAKGMPKESIAWFEGSPAFEVAQDARVNIVARYPSDPKQILLSGWALGAGKIAGRAALVQVNLGKGKIILFGFRPQYRGQSLATFPLLFNAIAN